MRNYGCQYCFLRKTAVALKALKAQKILERQLDFRHYSFLGHKMPILTGLSFINADYWANFDLLKWHPYDEKTFCKNTTSKVHCTTQSSIIPRLRSLLIV